MVADFSPASTKELVLAYKVGWGHEIEYELYAGSCKSPTSITNIAVKDNSKITPPEGQMNILVIGYSFIKSSITASNIWNETASSIELCQVLQLILEGNGGQKMIIAEDKQDIRVDFNITYDYDIKDVALEEATLNVNKTSQYQC